MAAVDDNSVGAYVGAGDAGIFKNRLNQQSRGGLSLCTGNSDYVKLLSWISMVL